MSFNNYRSSSFTDSLYKKVDELSYKIVAVTRQVNVVQQFLKDEGITLPEGGGGNPVPDYSSEMVVLQQLVNNIPVPNTYTTITLTEFISRALKAYNIITNYQPHLEHLPILPHLGYETLTWPEVIEAVKNIPNSFLPNTLQNMYDNVFGSLTGTGGSGSGSSAAVDYEARIEVLERDIIKIPTSFTINTLPIMYEDVRVHNQKFTYIPIYTSFNVEAWDNVKDAVKKIPSVFTVNNLQELYDDVFILKNNIPTQDLLNISSLETVFLTAIKIPNTFNSNTLQQMYNDLNDLKNSSGSGSGSGESGSSSSTDYSKDIQALQSAVGALQTAIPSTFNSSTWTNARANISEILSRIANLPYLPNLPEETYTWVKLVNAAKKVPESFLLTTLQTMYDDVIEMKDRFTYIPNPISLNIQTWSDYVEAVKKVPTTFQDSTLQTMYNDVDYMRYRIYSIPDADSFNNDTWSNIVNAITELQQTVSNMISQLNAQSLIDLNTLQTALVEADGSLQTIAERLEQMQ